MRGDGGEFGDVSREDKPSFGVRHRLKILLMVGDVSAILLAYTITLLTIGYAGGHGLLRTAFLLPAAAIAGVWAVRSQGLLLSRISSVRVVETTRIARAAVIQAGLVLLIDRIGHFQFAIKQVVVASSLMLVFLLSERSIYRSWLSAARRRGAYCRRIVLIGTDDESARLHDLLMTHSELGFVVTGVIGSREEAVARDLGDLWLGDLGHAEALVSFTAISGVVISASGIPPARLNLLIRNLHSMGVHLHLATGVAGIDSRRLLSIPFAYESLLYVAQPSLSRVQVVAKRLLDVSVATIALIVCSPLLAAVSLAIRLGDHGPVLFRQRRVGRDGREFEVLKFRTMSIDAEDRLHLLTSSNQRNGPLFKMDADPRVTKIGRYLREAGIDELPQLWNVLRGEMSLVGPRPALPSEVASFSPALRAREQVLPGITGLWQVEARDKPSFEAYRRLDLYYVENWSTTLDLMIILNTIEQFAEKLLRTLHRPSRSTSGSTDWTPSQPMPMPSSTADGSARVMPSVLDLGTPPRVDLSAHRGHQWRDL